jgi:hypothetical protein
MQETLVLEFFPELKCTSVTALAEPQAQLLDGVYSATLCSLADRFLGICTSEILEMPGSLLELQVR